MNFTIKTAFFDEILGKHRPRRGGVNCKSRDQESRRWQEFGMELKQRPFTIYVELFMWNIIIE